MTERVRKRRGEDRRGRVGDPAFLERMGIDVTVDRGELEQVLGIGSSGPRTGPRMGIDVTVDRGELEQVLGIGSSGPEGWTRLPASPPSPPKKIATAAKLRARAAELKAQGKTAAEIGVRIGFEEGRGPYDARQVRRWLQQQRERDS